MWELWCGVDENVAFVGLKLDLGGEEHGISMRSDVTSI